jgi:hypothetical protein
MSILCRFGRHSPARDDTLLDLNDMKRKAYCRRCDVALSWEPGAGWLTVAPGTARKAQVGADDVVQFDASAYWARRT